MSVSKGKLFDSAAFFHREIATRLLSRLDLIRLEPQLMVELNCTTGYCTQLLKQRFRKAELIGIDSNIEFLNYAKRKTPWHAFLSRQPHFIAANNPAQLPLKEQSVDLLIANLMVFPADVTRNLVKDFFRAWQRILKPDGLLLFSTVGPDTLQELRQSWQQVDNFSHVHNFLDMHDIGDELLQAGFSDPVMDREDVTLAYKNIPALWQDLKNLGLRNSALNRKRGLTTKSKWQAMEKAYQAWYTDSYFPVTIEINYAHAWNVVKKPTGVAEISLSNIKKSLKNN